MGAAQPLLLLTTVLLHVVAAQAGAAVLRGGNRTSRIQRLPKLALANVLAGAKVGFGRQESVEVLREKVRLMIQSESEEEDSDEMAVDLFDRRQLTCACTTSDCVYNNATTCTTEYKCYMQYLDKMDGSDPESRGCISGNTPILCENRHPVHVARANWPYLVCCDTANMCNQGPLLIPTHVVQRGSRAQRPRDAAGSGTPRQWLSGANKAATTVTPKLVLSVSQPVVLSVLSVGLLILIGIMAFGFHVLSKQSLRMQQRYLRAPAGDSPPLLEVSSASSEEPPKPEQPR